MNLKSAFVLLLGTAVSGWATTSFVAFNQPSVTVNVGDTFELAVVLDTDAQVGAFSFDVIFPTFLQVLSDPAEQGFFLANGCCYSFTAIDNVGGAITGISDVSISGTDTGIDPLVTIDFTAVGTGTDNITFQNVSLSDGDGNLINVDYVLPAEVTSTTPEPATWMMAALGVPILLVLSRRNREKQKRMAEAEDKG